MELTATQELIEQECYHIRDLLLDKNRKYGDSAINPVRIFSSADAVEQINVRIDDKLSRIASNQGDDTEDAELDLIGYLVLKRVAMRAGRIIEHLANRQDSEAQHDGAIMADDDFEELIERVFWDFDAKRKQGSLSERDLFKGCLRSLCRRHNCHNFTPQPHGLVKQQDLDSLKAAATLMPNIAECEDEWLSLPSTHDNPVEHDQPLDGRQIDQQLRAAHQGTGATIPTTEEMGYIDDPERERRVADLGFIVRTRCDQAVDGVTT